MTLTLQKGRLMSAKSICLAAAAALSLVAAGCGSDDESTSEPASTAAAPPAATTAAAPAALAGTYERRLTRSDIERTASFRDESGPNQETPSPGAMRMAIAGDVMKFTVLASDPPFVIEQNITATAGRLSVEGYINPQAGSFCGPQIPQNASYDWSVEGDVLTLRAVRDRCADRDSSLTGEWERSS